MVTYESLGLEKDTVTVGDMRKLLEGVPDNVPFFLRGEFGPYPMTVAIHDGISNDLDYWRYDSDGAAVICVD